MSTESVLVSWKPPAEPNGDVNQYTVYIKPSGDNKDVCINNIGNDFIFSGKNF